MTLPNSINNLLIQYQPPDPNNIVQTCSTVDRRKECSHMELAIWCMLKDHHYIHTYLLEGESSQPFGRGGELIIFNLHHLESWVRSREGGTQMFWKPWMAYGWTFSSMMAGGWMIIFSLSGKATHVPIFFLNHRCRIGVREVQVKGLWVWHVHVQ